MMGNTTIETTKNVDSSKRRKPFANVNGFAKKEQDMKIAKQVETAKDRKPLGVIEKGNVTKKGNEKKKTSEVCKDRGINKQSNRTSQKSTYEGNKTITYKKDIVINKSTVDKENLLVNTNKHNDEIKIAKFDYKSEPKKIQGIGEVEGNNEKEVEKISDNLPAIALREKDDVNFVTFSSLLALNRKFEDGIKIDSPPISPICGKAESGDNVQNSGNETIEEGRCHEECDRRANHNTTEPADSCFERMIEKTYVMDNLEYLRQREKTIFLDPNYLENHPVVDKRKRSILVDWLIEVAERCNCSQETIFLAVTYIDCFLSQAVVKVHELQLLGVTALLIACKYEELRSDCVEVSDCIFLTNNMYTRAQIYDMEIRILTVLRFDVGMPTTSTFMDIFSTLCEMEGVEIAVARYIAELSLLEGERTLKFAPSVQAASALLLGSCIADEIDPTELELSKPFGFTLDELKPCMVEMLELHRKAPQMKLLAVRAKYSVQRYYCVSKTTIVS